MKQPQFKGYILEEILAYLIKSSGYSLITTVAPHDPDLSNLGNGLNIKGRGAMHQIDVLGELNWIPAFNFPLRLLIEAKFRNEKTGVEVIRDQVGILSDINQNFFTLKNDEPKLRYQYNSAVFSMSGFTKPAIDMAVAHQIQVIDMSGIEYDDLKEAIQKLADDISPLLKNLNGEVFGQFKRFLRSKFYNPDVNIRVSDDFIEPIEVLVNFVKTRYQKLFVGMSQGGFMLLMKADDPEDFIKFAKEKPTHYVNIHWSGLDGGKKWAVQPIPPGDYSMEFQLPEKLHNWIFKTSKDRNSEALNQKQSSFSKISVYYQELDRDYIFNLKFDKSNREDVE